MRLRDSTTQAVTPKCHVERRTLHELLDAAALRRIGVVIAAAGWGKSTAVDAWPRSKAWVRHECHQADADRFFASLLRALQPHVPTPPMGIPEPADAGDEGAAVCNWLRRSLRDDLVLVIDDAHELPPGSGPARLVEGLCRYAPDRLHVILVSRLEPPFSLARLHGQGLVTEIHAPELAFGVAEVAALLRTAIGDCPPAFIRHVWERTAGWPAAVCRTVEMLRGVPADERLDVLDRLVHPGEHFHRYLLEEVLDRESEPTLQLLRRLAVFGAVRPATATATGITDAEALLADLARRGLVRRIPGRTDRWSLVRPLRDYFDHEPALSPGERVALHRAAAWECASRGAFGEALRHTAAAGDHAACRAQLVEHGDSLVNSGQVGAVLEAANLPPQYLNDPRIQRVLGQARQVRGQWARALECFRRASRDQNELDPEVAWRVGLIAYNQAEFDAVLELPGRTRLSQLDTADTADEARVFALVATARRMVGDYAGCRADSEQTMAIAQRCGDPCALAAGHTVLSILAAAEGDRRQAESHCTSALEAAEAGGDLLQLLRMRVLRAVTLGELGVLQDALTEAEIAVTLGERCEDTFLIAQALTARGTARARLGMLEPALADFGAARDLFQRIGSRFLAWPLCGLGDIHRMRGQLARARAAYEEAYALAEPCRFVVVLGSALIGLARVRAADDPAVALELAERAVALGEGMRHVQALLTRGWVAILAGNREAAADDATAAAAAASARRDDPGLAEALLLSVLCAPNSAQRARPLAEAIQIWHEIGCRIEEAAARLVASRVGAIDSNLGADFAIKTLRDCGINLDSPRPAGPLAVLARSAPSVGIRALGVFQVIRDGVPVSKAGWQSRKARQLLKILIARRRPVPREQLMELLWPEADPSRSGNRLSVLLSTLRDVLQPNPDQADSGLLITDGSAIWLDQNQVDIDVERFITLAAAALEANRHGQHDALLRLVAAEAAHTGEFLEDDPYQEWAAPLAEEIRATHVALLRTLVFRQRKAGEVDEVIRYTLRLLDKDPYDERAHLDLIDVLLDAGRHGEARRRYRIYTKAMTELSVEPRPFRMVGRGDPRRTG